MDAGTAAPRMHTDGGDVEDRQRRSSRLRAALDVLTGRRSPADRLRAVEERSERLVEALSDLGDGVAVGDGRRIFEINDALCELSGYSREELLAMPSFLTLVLPEERAPLERALQRLLTSPTAGAERFETAFTARDGTRVDVLVAARVLHEPAGPRLIAAVRDVSDHKRAVRASRRRARHLGALQQLESRLAGLLDVREAVDLVAAAVRDVVGCGASALVLVDGVDAVATVGVGDEDASILVSRLEDPNVRAALAGHDDDVVPPTLLELPTGHVFAARSACVLVRSRGRLLGVLTTGAKHGGGSFDELDLAVLRELAGYVGEAISAIAAYRAQVDANAALRDIDAGKDLMLTTVAHDLRSPLSTIAAMGRTLEQRGDQLRPDDRRDLATRIAVRAERLASLVTDLLDLDRVRRGLSSVVRSQVRLDEVVEDVVADHGDAAGRVEVLATPVTAHVDAPKTERIVANLVGNALKHTPEGTPVWVRVGRRDGGVELVVEDAGPGIPERDRERLFAPFERGEVASEGFGVGLALVRRFAEAQGGHVALTDRAGGGASFRVWLPDVPPEDDHAPILLEGEVAGLDGRVGPGPRHRGRGAPGPEPVRRSDG